MTQNKINYPEQSYRIGRVSAAIWCNKTEKDGREVEQFSIKLQKRYQDANGEWKGSEVNVFPSDLPALIKVAEKAYEHCMLKESSEDPEKE
jgi:hypothetical protein